MEKTYVVDTSVVIERAISKLINKKTIKGKILVPRAVMAELENQANKGQETGMLGLDELQSLQELKKQGKIELDFVGNRPTVYQIKYAKVGGEIDALIRELAYNEDAILITADKIQAEAAKATGIEVFFIELKKPKEKLEIEKFFDEKTMSVHLKDGCFVFAKKGSPGDWKLTKISNEELNTSEIQSIAKEIVEKSRIDPKSFVEISRRGSTIVQYKNYRIVIVKPPVADAWEITAVKPIIKLKLKDYNLPEPIFNRIKEEAQGIIVAGETGSGKSTFASAIAEFYAKDGRITKTVESPRDLVLGQDITQYSKNFATSEEIHDILFLSRPDNIIFDEMRDTPDFKLYVDLRLGGSAVIGVLHSASPIDAVQRFIARLDTGMIPSVLDTILFIDKGKIHKVLTLKITVKVPTGMTEADLARPVVTITDFETGKLEYEIYSYGEETVVIPIGIERKGPAFSIASKQIENEFRKYSDKVKAEVISENKAIVYVPESHIAKIIGKQGKNIEAIEKKIGIKLDVRALEGEEITLDFDVKEKKNNIIIYTKPNTSIDVFIDDQFLFTATSSKKGELKINNRSKIGRTLLNALNKNKNIRLVGNV